MNLLLLFLFLLSVLLYKLKDTELFESIFGGLMDTRMEDSVPSHPQSSFTGPLPKVEDSPMQKEPHCFDQVHFDVRRKMEPISRLKKPQPLFDNIVPAPQKPKIDPPIPYRESTPPVCTTKHKVYGFHYDVSPFPMKEVDVPQE